MNMVATDLFGEDRIHIEGNPKLEGIANHILQIYKRIPEVLDGETIGEINRKVHLEVMLDNGLLPVLQTGDTAKFREWYLDKKSNSDTEEEVARALRFLVQHDHLRLKASVIRNSEQNKARITESLKCKR